MENLLVKNASKKSLDRQSRTVEARSFANKVVSLIRDGYKIDGESAFESSFSFRQSLSPSPNPTCGVEINYFDRDDFITLSTDWASEGFIKALSSKNVAGIECSTSSGSCGVKGSITYKLRDLNDSSAQVICSILEDLGFRLKGGE